MSTESIIRVLPDQIVNKIAAGEVVDRPSSVLKELMENAIDAGATQIDVEVVSGGKKVISVADNGKGMTRDDALLCIERHATSKIRDVHDIEKVQTLGFRGEALAAVASVSRFSVKTRPADEVAGTEIIVNGGKMVDVTEAGTPPGTTIKVRNLFFNVPARRRFLRTDQTELTHVRKVFNIYALGHAHVGMSLRVDEREVNRLTPGASLDQRLRELFSGELTANLLPVNHVTDEMKITGHVGLPQVRRNDSSEQYIFINGRPASAPLISYALNQAYHSLIPKGKYPVVFIFVAINPELVDVNVHPTKKEVRFRRPLDIRDAMIEAVRNALAQRSRVEEEATIDLSEESQKPEPRFVDVPLLQIEDMPQPHTFHYPRIPLAQEEVRVAATDRVQMADSKVGAAVEEPVTDESTGPWSWCRVVGQVGGLYVILETEDGMVLMDPHAAHERVMFERFMARVVRQEVKGQGLLAPVSVELSPTEAMTVRKNLPLLQNMGFGVSDFGADTFIVDAVPGFMSKLDVSLALSDIAGNLSQGGARGGTPRWAEEKVAQAACKASVKARDKLSLAEIEQLVIDLAKTEMPYTCPHGRPTLIYMSYNELDRKFGRST